MRNISFDDIMKTVIRLSTLFTPTADDEIIFSNETYNTRAANGSFARVPTFLTNTDNEGSLFVQPYSSGFFPNGTTEAEASFVLACLIGMLAV